MPGCLVRILSVINRDSFLQHGNRHGYNSPPKSSQDQGKACLWFLISAHQTERPNITSKFNWWSTAPRPIHVGASKSHGDITFDFTIYERVPQVWGERNGFAACLPFCWPNGGQKSSASIHSEDLNFYRGSLAHQNFSKKISLLDSWILLANILLMVQKSQTITWDLWNLVNSENKLPTPTGKRRISDPSTVGNNWISIFSPIENPGHRCFHAAFGGRMTLEKVAMLEQPHWWLDGLGIIEPVMLEPMHAKVIQAVTFLG